MKKHTPQTHKAALQHLHLQRFSWFTMLAIGLFITQALYSFEQIAAGTRSVLAYATSVSHSDLLASTNQHRAANGLGGLSAQRSTQ